MARPSNLDPNDDHYQKCEGPLKILHWDSKNYSIYIYILFGIYQKFNCSLTNMIKFELEKKNIKK